MNAQDRGAERSPRVYVARMTKPQIDLCRRLLSAHSDLQRSLAAVAYGHYQCSADHSEHARSTSAREQSYLADDAEKALRNIHPAEPTANQRRSEARRAKSLNQEPRT